MLKYLIFINDENNKNLNSRQYLTQKIDFESQIILALFDSYLALCRFTKYNNFLQVCCFLAKNLANFVTFSLKLDNQIAIGNRGQQANSASNSNDKNQTSSGSGGRIRRRSAPPVTLEGIFYVPKKLSNCSNH